MIVNARALETTYVPQDLEHREGQISQLATALEPLTHGVGGDHSLIFGPSGSGKTTLAKYVVRKLRQESLGVKRAYWNCMSGSSKTEVLHGLAQDSKIGNHLSRDGTASGAFIEAFRETDDHIVAIIDEVDVLEDETLLLGLGDLPNVTIVAITIDEDDFFANHQLNGRVKSRFSSAETVRLRRYSHSELVDILLARISAGLRPGVITIGVVEYISDIAAGDAREAIKHLEKATVRVARSDRSQITIDDVESVHHEARQDLRQDHINSLGTHKRLLHDIIADAGEIGVGELHDTYERRIRNPKPNRTRRRYLSSLVDKYELLESSGTGRGKSYTIAEP
ncbi:orc1/cdc6 family replication initiation protein [Halostagnicola sp. A-GB9-2]|uniref:Cdc6/Cdc18 family protein n=1 Tax=Halostagnicola sp. A-GB9-2 TaxID=3048066 RepID=UPI0024C013C7|nr:orc1/cdc6 family replication initiation protein [Halostagnicola sp. A-GB9-2]MDJ1433047.1 orc1/cdc6 family replication initiation protein [Halostagnicola sp. A-GB9-2]